MRIITLFDSTQDKKVLSAICFVLYENGNQEDIGKLRQKLDSDIDIELKQIVANAISWLRYKLAKQEGKLDNPDDPGPAHRSPIFDMS